MRPPGCLLDRQGIADARELLADMRCELGRGGANATDFPARVEIVRPLENNILRRQLWGEEDLDRKHRGVLCVSCPENHALGAGVVADLPGVLHYAAPF